MGFSCINFKVEKELTENHFVAVQKDFGKSLQVYEIFIDTHT